MSPGVFALVSIAGGVGAVTRFIIDGWIPSAMTTRSFTIGSNPLSWTTRFRWATMIINLSGSLLLGLLTGLSDVDLVSADWYVVIGTGFLGGYTTFSTASYETIAFIREHKHAHALLSSVGMLTGCVALAAIGLSFGKSV